MDVKRRAIRKVTRGLGPTGSSDGAEFVYELSVCQLHVTGQSAGLCGLWTGLLTGLSLVSQQVYVGSGQAC